MRKFTQVLALSAVMATLALPALAGGKAVSSTTSTVFAQQEDPAKAALYEKFTQNRKTNPQVAYDAAKEYLQKYSADNDQYVTYLQKWVASYDKEARKLKLPQLLYNDKNFAEGFSVGKQVLADEPENVRALTDLAYGGYLATTTAKNESFNADALNYARKAIQLIESGKVPEGEAGKNWLPFKSKEDTLAYLYYTVGFLNLKSNPNEAIPALIKAVSFNNELKTTPSTYFFLATAYESGPYLKMSADYKTNFEGKPESPESKLALANLNQVIDRAIDAYARAVAAAANDPKNATNRAEWQKRLTDLYKFRHNNTDAGLNEYMAGILAKPLPPQPTPLTTLPTEPATGPATGTPASGTSTPTGTTPTGTVQPTTSTTTPTTARPSATPAKSAQPVKPPQAGKPATSSATPQPKSAKNHARRP